MLKGSSSEHGTALLLSRHAVLIRGPSGSGKSTLALKLLEAAELGRLTFARLIADDRVALSAVNGRLIAAAPKSIEGKIELRGSGVVPVPFERFGVIGLIVDLAASDAERIPAAAALQTDILGVRLPRLPVSAGCDPLRLVLHALSGESSAA